MDSTIFHCLRQSLGHYPLKLIRRTARHVGRGEKRTVQQFNRRYAAKQGLFSKIPADRKRAENIPERDKQTQSHLEKSM